MLVQGSDPDNLSYQGTEYLFLTTPQSKEKESTDTGWKPFSLLRENNLDLLITVFMMTAHPRQRGAEPLRLRKPLTASVNAISTVGSSANFLLNWLQPLWRFTSDAGDSPPDQIFEAL
jgi:hypothetical protein